MEAGARKATLRRVEDLDAAVGLELGVGAAHVVPKKVRSAA